jgi:uncharacterized membrane protein
LKRLIRPSTLLHRAKAAVLMRICWNACGICGLVAALLLADAGGASAEVHYVDVNSTNATPPYTNWITAATNIQDAVDAAVAGDEIVVTNGTYSTGGDGFNRVGVGKPLNVRSVNGPQFTTINGGGQFRCVNLGSNAVLTGFTLTNGYALHGGGAQGGTLNNCTLSGNSAYRPGGQTASGGGAALCTLSGNSVSGVAAYGGGAAFCTLNDCTLSGNSTFSPVFDDLGGGAYRCALNNCTLTTNSADFGGGAANCTLNNCTLSSNYYVADSVLGGGGGAGNCTLNNCTLTGNNSFHYGGGTYGGTLNNCTLTGNSAGSGFGGGAYVAQRRSRPTVSATSPTRRCSWTRTAGQPAPAIQLTLHQCREQFIRHERHRSRRQPAHRGRHGGHRRV